jgi:membrane associated rhomboid family serine protease
MRPLLFMILMTAFITGLANLIFSNGALLGASGIVFMMILLASMANVRGGEIPLTFIAVAIIYMGGEIIRAFREDQISQMAHLVGGIAGAAFGFIIAGTKKKKPATAVKAGGASELDKMLAAAGARPKPKS